MNPQDIALVQQTFARLRPHADAVATLFYTHLFDLDPTLRPMFRGDISVQGRHLMGALAFVVQGLAQPDTILPTVRDLGRRHVAYGVRDEHYAKVGEALLSTLAAGLGAVFTPEVKLAWARAYALLSQEMMAAAQPPLQTPVLGR